jgi:hypothetical protein
MPTYPIAAVVGGDVWTTGTPSVALGSPESCTDSGNHTTYQASVHIAWDWTQTLTIQNSPNGSSSWVTVTDYTFQWATGKVVFNTPRVVSTNNFTRISVGSYYTATQLDATYEYDVTVEAKLKDTTPFQATGGWQQNTVTLLDAKGKIMTYRNDNRIFALLGKLVMVQLFLNKAGNVRWQFFCYLESPKDDVKVAGIEMQSITFSSVRDVYFLTS